MHTGGKIKISSSRTAAYNRFKISISKRQGLNASDIQMCWAQTSPATEPHQYLNKRTKRLEKCKAHKQPLLKNFLSRKERQNIMGKKKKKRQNRAHYSKTKHLTLLSTIRFKIIKWFQKFLNTPHFWLIQNIKLSNTRTIYKSVCCTIFVIFLDTPLMSTQE